MNRVLAVQPVQIERQAIRIRPLRRECRMHVIHDRIERLVENANGPGTVPDNGTLSEGTEKPEGELPF